MSMLIRKSYLDELNDWRDKHFIKVLTGIRRSGKSTILFQYRNELIKKHNVKKEQIIAYDFNELNFESYTYKQLHDEIISKAIKNKINYVFLDEIQEIDKFEKCILSLFENKSIKFDIYISGSNSHMFSDELATLLTGRTMPIKVFPIPFKEIYTNFYGNATPNETIYRYIKYGGLGITIPYINQEKHLEETLSMVYKDTLAKDIKNRHKKIEWNNFLKINDYIYNHIGLNISARKLENYTVSSKESTLNKDTIVKYLQWMCESLILHKVKYYDVKGKRSLITKTKYYAGDLGLLSSVVSYKINNNMFGYRLENLVFLELLSRGYEVYTYEDRFAREIDFVALKNNVTTYYQITFEIHDEDYERESRSLLSTKDGHEKIILTLSHNIPVKKDGIKIIHLFDWLMNNN